MAEPGFSVVTPSYEQGRFIERTVRSVLDQGIGGLEYRVVDGGSRDQTVEVLRRFEGRLIWTSEADEGQADAVNRGLAATTGELIGWLNSDDVYYPGALLAVRKYFAAHPEVDVLYGDADHIDEDDRTLEPYACEAWDPKLLTERCFLCQPAVFFRRRVVEQCGALDAGLRYCMDYEYWLRLSSRGMRFAYLRRKLAGSRLYATNKTLGQRVAVHAEINTMLRRTLGQVPDRWLSNYAHARLEGTRWSRERMPRRFVLAVAALSWLAALRWNRRLSRSLWLTTWNWIRGHWVAPPARLPPPIPADPTARRGGSGLRIGLDVSQTGTGKTGCGILADSLAGALAEIDSGHHYVLYSTFGADFWDPNGPGATRHIERPNFVRGPSHTSHAELQELWCQPPEDLDAYFGNRDVIHSHNFFCPRGLRRTRLVYTVHDLGFLDHPDWTTESNRLICFDGVFNASLCADLVVAVSESSRRRFLDLFPHYPQERTAVMHLASRFSGEGCKLRPRRPPALPKDGFLLAVGTLEPRKNPLLLLEAYADLTQTAPDAPPLVLAGGRGWLLEELERHVAELELSDRVLRLGYVDDPTLCWLYQNCLGFVYPSRLEGFGLPVVEAMSQGAAVITSNVTSLPEVAGDAALFVDPASREELAEALARLLGDEALRRDLRRRAKLQAARFSWHQTAQRALDCYRRVVSMPKLSSA